SLTIETAHATGTHVVLISDQELFEAHGTDFFYNAVTSQTILKGNPQIQKFKKDGEEYGVFAIKEGNLVYADDLEIVQQKGAQQATVRGHGRIDLLDQKTGKCPLHASWKESFATSRDEPLDVLTLVGNAKMIDDEHKQVLAGDRLQIWLQPGDEKGENDPQLNKSQGRRVHHLVATDHVF